MYAIIATGGKQYRVAEGDSIKIERIDAEVGSAVTFDQVLAVNNGELTIGCPTVEGATVSATVEKVGKGKKVIVYKYKRKSGYHKKNGQVNILRDRNEVVKGIDINGHAGYAEYGQDVICAAVSALVLNMANSVETFTDDHFEGSVGEDGGSFSFSFPDKISSESQLLMKSLILGLENIRDEYGAEYIKFRFREV